MRKTYFLILVFIISTLLIAGCSEEQQMTDTINDFITAYNERDIQKCLALFCYPETIKEDILDPNKDGSLQHYFNSYPSTPTISSVEIMKYCYIGEGTVIISVDFYSVSYDTSVYYHSLSEACDVKADAMAENTHSSKFALTETDPGIMGFYSTWKILDITGIPGLSLFMVFY